jgi:hypothetical protein
MVANTGVEAGDATKSLCRDVDRRIFRLELVYSLIDSGGDLLKDRIVDEVDVVVEGSLKYV